MKFAQNNMINAWQSQGPQTLATRLIEIISAEGCAKY